MNSSKTKQDSGLKLSHKLCIRDQIKTERTESSGQPSPDSAAARLCSGTCWIVQEIRDLVSIQMFADFHRASNCSHNGSLKSMQIASLTAKVGGAECSPVPAPVPGPRTRPSLQAGSDPGGDGENLLRSLCFLDLPGRGPM